MHIPQHKAHKHPLLLIALVTTGLMISQVALAKKGERKGPPQEAIAACEGLAQDDPCQFTGRDEEMTGTCFAPSEDKPLACRPEGGKGKGTRDKSAG